MQSITFKTTNGTELELRNIPTAATVDFVQAAVVLLEAVEDAIITNVYPEGTLYAEFLGGSAGLAVIGMNHEHEVDTENEDVGYAVDARETDVMEKEESQAGQEQVETSVEEIDRGGDGFGEEEVLLDPEIVKLMNDVVKAVVSLRVTLVEDNGRIVLKLDGDFYNSFPTQEYAEKGRNSLIEQLTSEVVGKCDECGEVHPFPTRATN